MIDTIKFTSDMIASFTLYVLIPIFGAIFTKKSLNTLTSFSSDEITVDMQVLTLPVLLFSKTLLNQQHYINLNFHSIYF